MNLGQDLTNGDADELAGGGAPARSRLQGVQGMLQLQVLGMGPAQHLPRRRGEHRARLVRRSQRLAQSGMEVVLNRMNENVGPGRTPGVWGPRT